MKSPSAAPRVAALCAAVLAALVLAACSSKETPAPPAAQAPAAAPPAAAPSAAAPAAADAAAQASWTPEALEDLLAPIALYPDPVLSQVLIASTNPQEVLDAGNWLIANETLSGKALDEAAAQAGFTPPVRALIQFPQVVDTMCMEMGWTTELGQAFVADQAGVLAAVQRLRMQAKDAGNLQSSPQMTVETQVQEGQEVVVLKPPKPEVVYVPQYDPVAAYAPAPAAAPAATTTVPATTTPVEQEKSGYSTGQMVATGVLAFGAGILVNELFDDDDNDNRHDYYYPNYGYGGMPYYPPYPYRPSYGGGYYPSQGYNRPPNWNGGYQNNGNIVINTGGNDYWNRYPNQGGNQARPRPVSSPITAARPNRPELTTLNTRPARPMPADYQRPNRDATAANWKGQSSYAGRDQRPAASRDPQERIANAQPGYSRPAAKPATRDAQRPPPKVQGSYAGRDREAKPAPATRDVQRPQTKDLQKPVPGTRDVQRPPVQGDRGYSKDKAPRPETRDLQPKPQTRDVQRPAPQPRPTAVGGAQKGGKADKAASQRGKQSLPQGARSKGGGAKKKQAR